MVDVGGIATMARPQRWSTPFGTEMTDEDVEALLQRPDIAAIAADNFPKHTPLSGVLRNDTRIVKFRSGDIFVIPSVSKRHINLAEMGFHSIATDPDRSALRAKSSTSFSVQLEATVYCSWSGHKMNLVNIRARKLC